MKRFPILLILIAYLADAMGIDSTDQIPRIKPGAVWKDDKGIHINAHGGGVLYYGNRYYWYGEHKIEGVAGNTAHVGVHVYSSDNLTQWKDEGIALGVSEEPSSEIEKGCIIERPKVIYNRSTGNFVMWFHLEKKNQGYLTAAVGIAQSNAPCGPFRFIKSLRPNAGHWPKNVPEKGKTLLSETDLQALSKFSMRGGPLPDFPIDFVYRRDFPHGQMSRDMTLFVDDDGQAYQIASAEENATLHISRLTSDFLDVTGEYVRIFPNGFNEAPAVFKNKGHYYLFTSGTTGWAPNPCRLSIAESIWGPWKTLGNPCAGLQEDVATTFHSQSTFVIPVAGKENAFIFMGDRWNPENAIDGRYVWLPILWENDKPVIRWNESWSLSEFNP